MLRVKKRFLNSVIIKGNNRIVLTNNLSQKELMHIKIMINSEVIEEYKPRKSKSSKKEDNTPEEE